MPKVHDLAPSNAETERLHIERQEMESKFSQCLMAWARIEDQLALILEGMLTASSENGTRSFGVAIYFAASSHEARFSILKAAMKEFVRGRPQSDRFMALWLGDEENEKGRGSIFGRLDASRKRRNTLAHRHIIEVGNNGRHSIRLSGSIVHHVMIGDQRHAPKLGIREMRDWLKEFLACLDLLNGLAKIMRLMHQEPDKTTELNNVFSVVEAKLPKTKTDKERA